MRAKLSSKGISLKTYVTVPCMEHLLMSEFVMELEGPCTQVPTTVGELSTYDYSCEQSRLCFFQI